MLYAGLGKECNNFVCPPPHLISTVLYHMESCQTKGTLVVPEWKSAPFWPLLCSFDRPLLFQDFVKDFCCLPKSGDMFIPGRVHLLFIIRKVRFFEQAPVQCSLFSSGFLLLSALVLISRSHVCFLLFVSSYRRFSSWIGKRVDIGKRVGVAVEAYDFSEPQSGRM